MSLTAGTRLDRTVAIKGFRAVLLPLVVLLAACGGTSPTSPTSPTPPSPTVMSATARSYITELLDIMQANSINRKTIDWPTFRLSVEGAAANAQTIQHLYPAIQTALRLLNDHHSLYQGPDSTYISSPAPIAAAQTRRRRPCRCRTASATSRWARSRG